VRTKDFGGCAIGGATLDGTVTLTFNRPLCVVLTAGDAVTRTADLTLTGRYGGHAGDHVTGRRSGRWTKTAEGFEYSVGGMERVLTGARAAARCSTSRPRRTTAPIVVTGSSRADLKIGFGQLRDRSQGRRLQGHADRDEPGLDQQLQLRVVGNAQRNRERRQA
jgi:hypothetical protein